MTTVDARKTAQFWDAVSAADAADMAATRESAFTGQPSAWFQHASALLEAAHPGLSFVIEVSNASPEESAAQAGRRPTIEITGGGIRSAIPAVLAVVDAAPEPVTARFDVRAFRARTTQPNGIHIRVGSTIFSPETLSWTSSPAAGRPEVCDITVYVPGWLDALGEESPFNHDRLQAVFLLLDHLVGEFAVMTQIGELRVQASAGAPADAQSLLTLGDHLDRIAAA